MFRISFIKITRVAVCTAAVFLMFLTPTVWAQSPRSAAAVTGEIQGADPGVGLIVELRGMGARPDATRAFVLPSGEFRFPRLEEGQYELRVTNLNGDVIHQDFVSIGPSRDYLRLDIPAKPVARPPSGTVSIAQLQRKLPGKAAKEYRDSLKEMQKGDAQKAIDHLTRALALARDYMEAHNALGVCRLKQQHLEAAAEEFQAAFNLDPGAATPAFNLSAALYLLKRFSDAEAAARRALKLDPALSKARYLLGMSLHAEKHFDDEMLQNLKRVAGEFPQARLAIADALTQLGRKTEAKLQLEQYLLQPGGPQDRHAVERWLADLQR